MSSFMGNMIWFTGVIEDIQDPEQLGRVRVRCYGYHTANKEALPTEGLPWATPIMPVTSASASGIGESATGLLAGSWVVGFFRDGETAQDPVILGSIPTRSFEEINTDQNIGFSDPDKKTPRTPGDPDIPKMATVNYDQSQFYIDKKGLQHTEIPLAAKPSLSTIEGSDDIIKFNNSPERVKWNTLTVEENTKPVYPYNHVKEYSAGHLFEVDETEGKERICRTHKTGTHDEYTADGSRTLIVKGDDYKVIFKDEKVYIKGVCNLTIDQDCNTFIKGNYNLEVEKDFNVKVGGSLKRKIKGNKLTEVGGDQNANVAGNEILNVSLDEDITIQGGSLNKVKGGDLTEDITTGHRYAFAERSINSSSKGDTIIKATGDISMNSSSSIFSKASGKIDKEATGQFIINGSQIYLN